MGRSQDALSIALANLRVILSKMEQAGDPVPKLTISEYNALVDHIKGLGHNLDALKVADSAIRTTTVEVKDSPTGPAEAKYKKQVGAPSKTVLPLVKEAIRRLESLRR